MPSGPHPAFLLQLSPKKLGHMLCKVEPSHSQQGHPFQQGSGLHRLGGYLQKARPLHYLHVLIVLGRKPAWRGYIRLTVACLAALLPLLLLPAGRYWHSKKEAVRHLLCRKVA